LLDNGLNLLNLLDLLDLLLDLLDLRSLYLVFNFIVFNSFDLSGLGNVVGYFLSNVFSSLYGNVFGFLNGDLFLNGVKDGSGNVLFLVFNGLVFGDNFFFRDNSGNSFLLRNGLFNHDGDFFGIRSFNFIIFDVFSLDGEVFDSRFSFDVGLYGSLLNNLYGSLLNVLYGLRNLLRLL